MSFAPKACSMEVVIETALPPASTMEMWLVPTFSRVASFP